MMARIASYAELFAFDFFFFYIFTKKTKQTKLKQNTQGISNQLR